MNIVSAKFSGNPDESGCTFAREFSPPDGKESRGRLFAISAGLSGSEILDKLQENYYKDTSSSAFTALKNAMDSVLEESLQIVAAAILPDTVYTAVSPGAEVAIYRNGRYATILKTEKGVISGSGKPAVNDLLILTTGGFLSESDSLKSALSPLDPTYSVESFAPSVHASETQSICGLIVIKFGEETHKEEDQPDVLNAGKEKKPGIRELVSSFELPKVFRRKIYVRQGEVSVGDSETRKTTITVGVILLILLTVSIIFGIRQRGLKSARAGYEAKLAEAKYKVEEAKALSTLSPDHSRELFAESKSLIDELISENPNDLEVKKLANEFESGRSKVLGEFDVALDEFVNLSLVDGFEAGLITSSPESIKVFDKAKRRIANIVIDSKKFDIAVGPAKLNQASGLASYANSIFVLEGDGVFEVEDSREKVLEKSWEGEAMLAAYGGNLYLLDKSADQIWRYPGIDQGFGTGSEWLAPGISPDLSNIVSWSIDGSVWILTSSGKIEKYTLGVPKDLNELKVFPELVDPVAIYTNEELASVYILDPESERVVVMDKEGNYKAQYKFGVLKDAIGLAASEKIGKVIVLTQDKLYSFSLSN